MMIRRQLAKGLNWLVISGLLSVATPAVADEGMWLPHNVPDAVMEDMHRDGLNLSRDGIFNVDGTGVANAVVRVGATGSFVSPDGLILTNHHVAFGAVQRLSTPEANYIEKGFLARTRQEEVPAHGYVVYVLKDAEDVTDQVLAAVDPSMTPLERYEAIEGATKEIVARAEAGGDVYCEVRSFWGGGQYILHTYFRIRDVRVVYVPSRQIGWYGGDIDNWMWPRHTGDFSFLRAYVSPEGKPAEFSGANVPYRPSAYLKVSPLGLEDGQFAVIMGFPGRTSRYLTSHGLAYYEDFEYPERIALYGRMIGILERRTEADPVAAVRVASRIKSLNNRLKNNQGMLDGFDRFGLVERQRMKETEMRQKVAADPAAGAVVEDLLDRFEAVYAGRRGHAMKDLLLDFLLSESDLAGQAMTLYKWSVEKAKPDMDREPEFMDREVPSHKRRLRVFQMGYDERSDREILEMLIRDLLELAPEPDGDYLRGVLGVTGGPELGEALGKYLDGLYAGTDLDRADRRLEMFEMSRDELMQQHDPFIELAAGLYDENQDRIRREHAFSGELSVLMPAWIEMVAKASGRVLYPDANGTMRLSYGAVRGYSPADGIFYEPFTTLRGVAQKNTGEPPFDCPERILDLVQHGGYDRYVDPELGDVPVNLLTTHDSTGGNSGSPVLNGRGELVGCLFDGNYEAMTSDFVFQPDLTRSISVDIRYILFIADYVDNAQDLLTELGVK